MNPELIMTQPAVRKASERGDQMWRQNRLLLRSPLIVAVGPIAAVARAVEAFDIVVPDRMLPIELASPSQADIQVRVVEKRARHRQSGKLAHSLRKHELEIEEPLRVRHVSTNSMNTALDRYRSAVPEGWESCMLFSAYGRISTNPSDR